MRDFNGLPGRVSNPPLRFLTTWFETRSSESIPPISELERCPVVGGALPLAGIAEGEMENRLKAAGSGLKTQLLR